MTHDEMIFWHSARYRPFKDQNEAMSAIKEYGTWLCHKSSGFVCQVIGYRNDVFVIGNDYIYTPSDALAQFTFANGIPFGKKEDRL